MFKFIVSNFSFYDLQIILLIYLYVIIFNHVIVTYLNLNFKLVSFDDKEDLDQAMGNSLKTIFHHLIYLQQDRKITHFIFFIYLF